MLITNTVPEHYNQLQNELEPLIVKISDTLRISPKKYGPPLENLGQVNMLMNDSLLDKLITTINEFARKVISAPTVNDATMANTLEDLKYAFHVYLTGYTKLCNRSFPKGFEEGHELTVAVYKRPLEQILELFENVIKSMNTIVSEQNTSGHNRIELKIKLNNDAEVERHTVWAEKSRSQLNKCNSENKVAN